MENKNGLLGMSRNSGNQFTKIFFCEENLRFMFAQRKLLEERPNYIDELLPTVRMYLHTNKIPKVWAQPIVNYILKGSVDAPLDNGISLEIDGQEVTQNKIPKISINPLVDEISDHRITISLSARVNISQIKKFLDNHKEAIELLSTVVGLPEVKPLPWKDAELYLRMRYLKETKEISFKEIADKFQTELDINNPKNTTTFDENTLKKIYNRFEKRIS